MFLNDHDAPFLFLLSHRGGFFISPLLNGKRLSLYDSVKTICIFSISDSQSPSLLLSILKHVIAMRMICQSFLAIKHIDFLCVRMILRFSIHAYEL